MHAFNTGVLLSEQVSSDNLLSDRAKPSRMRYNLRRYNHDGMDVDNSACHYGCEAACSVVLPLLPGSLVA